MNIAILCSAIPARVKLLERSLYTWDKSILSSGLNAKVYLYLEDKESNEWDNFYPYEFIADSFLGDIKLADRSGSHITGYNFWLEEYKVDADVFIFTHPDILFPFNTIETAYQLAIPNRFVGYKIYWIPEKMTDELDKYNWRNPESLEQEKDLYPSVDFADGRGEFYWNSDIRNKTEYHSTTTWAMNKETLQKLLPFPDFKRQGPDDPYFCGARKLLNIEDYCVMNPILYHQHHPQTWNQDMQDAIFAAGQELAKRFK